MMWRKRAKRDPKKTRKTFFIALVGLCIGGVLLAACGGANTSTGSGNTAMSAPSNGQTSSGGSAGSNQGNQPKGQGQGHKPAAAFGPQYLIKTLQVNMQVKDTRQVASELQQWVSATDPQSTSAGIDYEQVGDNLFNVTMTFSVQSGMYTQIEEYLAGYAPNHGGKLANLHETVQDVTNDYIDSQSQLTNLRAEQGRLLGFMKQAQNLTDTLAIEQQLTQVEGQIENIEQHLNALKNQTTYYTVTISLQPLTAVAPPPAPSTPWNAGQILHDAWGVVVNIGQGLLTLLIWLGVLSVYLVPIGAVAWFVWRRRTGRVATPVTSPGTGTTTP